MPTPKPKTKTLAQLLAEAHRLEEEERQREREMLEQEQAAAARAAKAKEGAVGKNNVGREHMRRRRKRIMRVVPFSYDDEVSEGVGVEGRFLFFLSFLFSSSSPATPSRSRACAALHFTSLPPTLIRHCERTNKQTNKQNE